MAQSRRLLFAVSAITPFAPDAPHADWIRMLAEGLQARDGYDVRVMMPRYGMITERAYRIHEVIRLSGTDVHMPDGVETLTVKVASIEDTSLQVYFMDHEAYFGRTAHAVDDDGAPFDDNPQRALFFARAAAATLEKLRWKPDMLHSAGWAAALLPAVLQEDYADSDVLADTLTCFTPDRFAHQSETTADALALPGLETNDPATLAQLGRLHATATIYDHASDAPDDEGATVLPADAPDDALHALYDQMLSEVPA
ncbi:glycogen/starch synthase [Salisaeta longa]|uniref:glycogen/starch synthase n=1 Tax=Salisaeta longa TaxID=503170 RepID=UPI0003B60967|nr:glycogen/starch synthase [Salisaeta longa]